jgi:hypothetical protein
MTYRTRHELRNVIVDDEADRAYEMAPEDAMPMTAIDKPKNTARTSMMLRAPTLVTTQ